MMFENRLDSLIDYHTARLWPEADWRLIKAQVGAESGFRFGARSPAGAGGLMQLLPATFAELLPQGDITDPDDNLDAGIRYLREQYEHFPEIPDAGERLKFALAAYNAGRGYINRALALARTSEGCERKEDGSWPPGRWQTWETAKTFLAVEGCRVNGKRPDYRQVWDYVERVMVRWAEYRDGGHFEFHEFQEGKA